MHNVKSMSYPKTGTADVEPLRIFISIIRICDSLDAATYKRPYRDVSKSWDCFLIELINKKGVDFHPDVVDVFLSEQKGLRNFWEELRVCDN